MTQAAPADRRRAKPRSRPSNPLVPDDMIRNLIRQSQDRADLLVYADRLARRHADARAKSLADLVVRRVALRPTRPDYCRSSRREELIGLLQRAGVECRPPIRQRPGRRVSSRRARRVAGELKHVRQEIHLEERASTTSQAAVTTSCFPTSLPRLAGVRGADDRPPGRGVGRRGLMFQSEPTQVDLTPGGACGRPLFEGCSRVGLTLRQSCRSPGQSSSSERRSGGRSEPDGDGEPDSGGTTGGCAGRLRIRASLSRTRPGATPS